MKFFLRKITLFILFTIPIFAIEHHIVLVHLGPKLPPHVPIALSQARLFNPKIPIYLILEERALTPSLNTQFAKSNTQLVFTKTIKKSPCHLQFLKKSNLDESSYKGLWRYSTERFFYIHDLMEQQKLQNVFHIESDVMLYVQLREILPIFLKHYQNIGVTFDNESRCIPGFCFFRKSSSIEALVNHMVDEAKKNHTDMLSIATFKNQSSADQIDYLPIVPPEYVQQHPLISQHKHRAKNPQKFYQHISEFNSLFDAAALGQYLGGIDPINGQSKPGFINESCVFNPSYCKFTWKKDNQNRLIPYLIYGKAKYRINNLHIHSKKLDRFYSLR